MTATPSSLKFTSCGTFQSVALSATTPGSYPTTVSVSDSGDGIYDPSRAAFTLKVLAPADSTAPEIDHAVSGTLGNGGWYTSNVDLSWSVTDDQSAVSSKTGCDPVAITADQAATTYTCTATSAGGTASKTVTIKRDATKPEVSLTGGPTDGATYDYGDVPAAPDVSASDNMSGVASKNATGYSAAVGSHTITATATDNAGNTATTTISYTVRPWRLSGFYAPVDYGTNVVNTVKGGATVPLKFEVFKGSEELTSTSEITGFTVKKVSCSTGAEEDTVEMTSTGGTSLRYDTTAGQFIQNWQTPKAAGSCYTVTVGTQDGSSIPAAAFKLK